MKISIRNTSYLPGNRNGMGYDLSVSTNSQYPYVTITMEFYLWLLLITRDNDSRLQRFTSDVPC